MVSWFGGESDVSELIARRKYAKAIEVIRAQLKRGAGDPRMRMQLADVLILSDQPGEAIPVLTGLADEYASQVEAAKAIALLKKIERLEPGRSDVAAKLARLIKKDNKPRPKTQGYVPREGAAAEGYEPAGAVFSADHFEAQASSAPAENASVEAARKASWVPPTRQEEPPADEPAIELPPVPEPQPGAFKGQILDVIHEVLQTPETTEAAPGGDDPAMEVIETPLFTGFSQEELLAVMQGLRLVSFEPGDIILTEGDSGDSLFILTTGLVKTFVKNPGGSGQRMVRTMGDGAFFGEISILSGKPRTATVTAATRCELLELDRATLDGITKAQPRVRQVLEEFYIARATSQDA